MYDTSVSVAILAQGLFCSIPRGFVAGLTGGIRRAGGLLVRGRGPFWSPPYPREAPGSWVCQYCALHLLRAVRDVVAWFGAGKLTRLPSFLIWESPTLLCTFYSLRGRSCSECAVRVAWRSAAKVAPIRIHFGPKPCRGLCAYHATSGTFPWGSAVKSHASARCSCFS